MLVLIYVCVCCVVLCVSQIVLFSPPSLLGLVTGVPVSGQEQGQQVWQSLPLLAFVALAAAFAAFSACGLRGGRNTGDKVEKPGLHQHLLPVDWRAVRASQPPLCDQGFV